MGLTKEEVKTRSLVDVKPKRKTGNEMPLEYF